MKVNCYAVYDAKISDFHLAIFDIKHEGAIRQFSDAVNDKQTKWSRHPEDYSLWYIGEFDTTKGALTGVLPENLVNASAVISLTSRAPEQIEMFQNNNEKEKITVN